MTRINVGYPVEKLTNAHLLAEHREIKRIPNIVRTGKAIMQNIPDTFRLGTGHVKFFYNKLGYLLKRYDQIYQECLKRNFKVEYYGSAWEGIPNHLMSDWKPNKKDCSLIVERIKSKLNK